MGNPRAVDLHAEAAAVDQGGAGTHHRVGRGARAARSHQVGHRGMVVDVGHRHRPGPVGAGFGEILGQVRVGALQHQLAGKAGLAVAQDVA
jgi:hypothetical protein